MRDMFNLTGRVALVTGASRGLGAALALGLAEAGADLVITSRTAEALQETAGRVRGLGRQVTALALDQTDTDALVVLGELGVEILVNNAGVEQVAASVDVTPALWDHIVDTNLKGAFFTTQAVARGMLERGRGAVINVASMTSFVGVGTAVPYGSSKSGLLGMTRALATEWAGRGVRVNAIAPGYFRTDLTEVFYRDEDWAAAMLGKIPQRRFGQGTDLCGAVVFLASDAASYITGQCIAIDGGFLASI